MSRRSRWSKSRSSEEEEETGTIRRTVGAPKALSIPPKTNESTVPEGVFRFKDFARPYGAPPPGVWSPTSALATHSAPRPLGNLLGRSSVRRPGEKRTPPPPPRHRAVSFASSGRFEGGAFPSAARAPPKQPQPTGLTSNASDDDVSDAESTSSHAARTYDTSLDGPLGQAGSPKRRVEFRGDSREEDDLYFSGGGGGGKDRDGEDKEDPILVARRASELLPRIQLTEHKQLSGRAMRMTEVGYDLSSFVGPEALPVSPIYPRRHSQFGYEKQPIIEEEWLAPSKMQAHHKISRVAELVRERDDGIGRFAHRRDAIDPRPVIRSNGTELPIKPSKITKEAISARPKQMLSRSPSFINRAIASDNPKVVSTVLSSGAARILTPETPRGDSSSIQRQRAHASEIYGGIRQHVGVEKILLPKSSKQRALLAQGVDVGNPPRLFGILRPSRDHVDVHGAILNRRAADSLAAAVKGIELRSLLLQHCKLSDETVQNLFGASLSWSSLQVLDVSDNELHHAASLKRGLAQTKDLRAISLSRSLSKRLPPTDTAVSLVQSITRAPSAATLRVLCLSDVRLSRGSIDRLAGCVASSKVFPNLAVLDLSANGLAQQDAVTAIEMLEFLPSLETVDLSQNSIGGLGERSTSIDGSWEVSLPMKKLAALLCDPSFLLKLSHLSMDNTSLSHADGAELQNALDTKHRGNLIGLHLVGNQVLVDAAGRIRPTDSIDDPTDASPRRSAGQWERYHARRLRRTTRIIDRSIWEPRDFAASGGHVALNVAELHGKDAARHLGSHLASARPTGSLAFRLHTTCWICGSWRPWRFRWRSGLSGPHAVRSVHVLTSFDDYAPVSLFPVDEEKNTWEVVRMVPFHRFFFVFFVDGVGHAAMDAPFCNSDDAAALRMATTAQWSMLSATMLEKKKQKRHRLHSGKDANDRDTGVLSASLALVNIGLANDELQSLLDFEALRVLRAQVSHNRGYLNRAHIGHFAVTRADTPFHGGSLRAGILNRASSNFVGGASGVVVGDPRDSPRSTTSSSTAGDTVSDSGASTDSGNVSEAEEREAPSPSPEDDEEMPSPLGSSKKSVPPTKPPPLHSDGSPVAQTATTVTSSTERSITSSEDDETRRTAANVPGFLRVLIGVGSLARLTAGLEPSTHWTGGGIGLANSAKPGVGPAKRLRQVQSLGALGSAAHAVLDDPSVPSPSASLFLLRDVQSLRYSSFLRLDQAPLSERCAAVMGLSTPAPLVPVAAVPFWRMQIGGDLSAGLGSLQSLGGSGPLVPSSSDNDALPPIRPRSTVFVSASSPESDETTPDDSPKDEHATSERKEEPYEDIVVEPTNIQNLPKTELDKTKLARIARRWEKGEQEDVVDFFNRNREGLARMFYRECVMSGLDEEVDTLSVPQHRHVMADIFATALPPLAVIQIDASFSASTADLATATRVSVGDHIVRMRRFEFYESLIRLASRLSKQSNGSNGSVLSVLETFVAPNIPRRPNTTIPRLLSNPTSEVSVALRAASSRLGLVFAEFSGSDGSMGKFRRMNSSEWLHLLAFAGLLDRSTHEDCVSWTDALTIFINSADIPQESADNNPKLSLLYSNFEGAVARLSRRQHVFVSHSARDAVLDLSDRLAAVVDPTSDFFVAPRVRTVISRAADEVSKAETAAMEYEAKTALDAVSASHRLGGVIAAARAVGTGPRTHLARRMTSVLPSLRTPAPERDPPPFMQQGPQPPSTLNDKALAGNPLGIFSLGVLSQSLTRSSLQTSLLPYLLPDGEPYSSTDLAVLLTVFGFSLHDAQDAINGLPSSAFPMSNEALFTMLTTSKS